MNETVKPMNFGSKLQGDFKSYDDYVAALIERAEQDLGPLGGMRLDLILDNSPLSIDRARELLAAFEVRESTPIG